MDTETAALVLTIGAVGLGAVLGMAYLAFGSPGGQAALADMHAVEERACSCSPGDMDCIAEVQSLYTDMINLHLVQTEVTLIQQWRLDSSADRTVACLERALQQ